MEVYTAMNAKSVRRRHRKLQKQFRQSAVFLGRAIRFGTHQRKYPASVGLKGDRLFGQERWYHPMFYPFLQSRRDHTALKLGGRAAAEAETTSDSASDALAVKRA